MRVSIATTPNTGGDGIDDALADDVELAKAAVLYADEVELIGLTASMLRPFSELQGLSFLELMLDMDDDAFAYIRDRSGSSAMPDGWRDQIQKFLSADPQKIERYAPAAASELRKIKAKFEEEAEGYRAQFDEVLGAAGFAELQPAINQGIVRLADLQTSPSSLFRAREDRRPETDQQVNAWLSLLRNRLDDPNVRLLFDQQSADLIQSMINEGHIEASANNLRLAASAALGTGFVARLPAFERAPMDELLDLRRDLRVPLQIYRGAMSRFSRDMPRVIGRDLEFEVQHLWESEVNPAVIRLEEELAQHGLVRELFRSVRAANIFDFATWTGMTAATVGSTADLGAVLTGVVAAGSGGMRVGTDMLLDAARQRGDAERDATRSEFYFLYQANRRLQR
ncbi:hypothetical protein [Nocardioides lianchengensis]|uniref:hypothetical protein n=1 Tax=Nocardioides lianchengensis TaxID=1045774 RepID=UPI000B86CE71|nr:hypothetical protein [Nocardioides lianchengensis]NYG08775.1 hypothetical protein [Nocardioides lianchengensis]